MDAAFGPTEFHRRSPYLPVRIGAVRFHRQQFNRRVRARTTTHAPTRDQREWLDDFFHFARTRGGAPWAEAMLSPRARLERPREAKDGESEATDTWGPRWLLYWGEGDRHDTLRLSAPFAQGGQSIVQEALDAKGRSFVVRTEFFETALRLPRYVQSAKPHQKWDEHNAQLACQSPLTPLWYLAVQRFDKEGSTGELYSVLQPGVADVRQMVGPWHPPSPTLLSVVAAQIAIDVGKRLSLLHRTHAHADIKPENILLMNDGRFEPTDFGLSKRLHNETVDGEVAEGSWHYMSPEALLNGLNDRLVGAPSDMFSLGLTLLDTLTQFARFTPQRSRDVVAREELRQGLLAWGGAKGIASCAPMRNATTQTMSSTPWDQLRQRVAEVDNRWFSILDSLLAVDPAERLTAPELVRQARALQRDSVGSYARRWRDQGQSLPRDAFVFDAFAPNADPVVANAFLSSFVEDALSDAVAAYATTPPAITRAKAAGAVAAMPIYPHAAMVKSKSLAATSLSRGP